MNRKEMVSLIDELESQVHNLTLYLDYVRENHPLVYGNLERYFDGLPGYVPVQSDERQS